MTFIGAYGYSYASIPIELNLEEKRSTDENEMFVSNDRPHIEHCCFQDICLLIAITHNQIQAAHTT